MITFKSKDGKYEFTVMDSFIHRCPSPETIGSYELIVFYYITDYLHNPYGPALIKYDYSGHIVYEQFHIDGKHIEDDEARQLIYNNNYNKKLNDLLKEDEE